MQTIIIESKKMNSEKCVNIYPGVMNQPVYQFKIRALEFNDLIINRIIRYIYTDVMLKIMPRVRTGQFTSSPTSNDIRGLPPNAPVISVNMPDK